MSDLNDFKNKNTVFTGTTGLRVSDPTGTEAQRVDETARLRFNADTGLMEYDGGTNWKPIDSPPSITSISPSSFASDGTSTFTIQVTGSNFSSSVTAKFVNSSGVEIAPTSVTRVSSSRVDLVTTAAMDVAGEPYDIIITNSSGLAATLEDALDAGSAPTFSAAAGSLGTLNNGNRAASALTYQTFGSNTDADGTTISYSITSGALPTGMSLGTSGNNGTIQGTADAETTNTTYNFTITASDGVNTASRAYSITVNAPQVQTYNSGSGSFSVPSGISAVNVLVVAGGGGGGARSGGGGGGGGLIYRPALPVTPGGSVPYSVGGGGSPGIEGGQQYGGTGSDSVFGPLTAKGGGGANDSNSSTQPGAGGSGGGQGYDYGPNNPPGTQPGQAGDSGTYGFGNPGGQGRLGEGQPRSGGGGGSGGAGGPAAPQQRRGGYGGQARTYNISGSPVTYAGGGSGGAHPGPVAGEPQPVVYGGGGVGKGGIDQSGQAGSGNRGGGGGGSGTDGGPGGSGGAGGQGIIIIEY